MALTCEELLEKRRLLRARDKKTRNLVERGLTNDPAARAKIIESKRIAAKLRDEIREAGKPIGRYMRITNIGRGFVTSRPYTAANNIKGNLRRMFMESSKVPTRVLTQKLTKYGFSDEGARISKIVENFADLKTARNPKVRKAIDELLEINDQYERAFFTFASDISKLPESGSLKGIDRWITRFEKAADRLGVLNRAADDVFFRPAFLTRLREISRREGFDLVEILKQDQLGKIKPEWVKEATDHAMDMVYKREINQAMPNVIGQSLQAINRSPNALQVIPFPRFLANSYRYIVDHSPLGLYGAIKSKDSRKLASVINGTAMLGVGVGIRMEFGGEQWYELNLPEWAGGGTVDIRRWAPDLAPYVFAADIGMRLESGREQPEWMADFGELVGGVNMRGGPLQTAVRSGRDLSKTGLSDEAVGVAADALANIGVDIGGRYVAPFTTLTDAFRVGAGALGFEEPLKKRDTTRKPVRRLVASVTTGMNEPEEESATRAATPTQGVRSSLARFAGQRVDEPKNRIEKELDEQGVGRVGRGASVYTNTGVPKWDRLMKRIMGELSDERADEFLDGEYAEIEARVREESPDLTGRDLRKQINLSKREALKDFYKQIRKDAKARARAEEGGEELYQKQKSRRLGRETYEREQAKLAPEDRVPYGDLDEEEPDEEE